jgi:hypothetical protein
VSDSHPRRVGKLGDTDDTAQGENVFGNGNHPLFTGDPRSHPQENFLNRVNAIFKGDALRDAILEGDCQLPN